MVDLSDEDWSDEDHKKLRKSLAIIINNGPPMGAICNVYVEVMENVFRQLGPVQMHAWAKDLEGRFGKMRTEAQKTPEFMEWQNNCKKVGIEIEP